MRNLSPARRRAVILGGACAAVVPSATILMKSSNSEPVQFAGGLIVGVMIALLFGTIIKIGRSNC